MSSYPALTTHSILHVKQAVSKLPCLIMPDSIDSTVCQSLCLLSDVDGLPLAFQCIAQQLKLTTMQ